MKFMKLIIVAATFNLSGCWMLVDNDTVTKTKNFVTGAPKNQYPKATQDAFLYSCTENNSLPYCECVLKGIQNKLTLSQFSNEDKFVQIMRYVSPEMTEVLDKSSQACSR
jgi:hypothetical protein